MIIHSNRTTRRILLLVLTFVCFSYARLIAQNGGIKGRVVDDKNMPIPGVMVKLLMDWTPVLTTQTDENGNYRFVNISAGRHGISLHGIGYIDYKLINILVSPDKLTLANITLKPSALDNVVEVNEYKVPLIHVYSPSRSMTAKAIGCLSVMPSNTSARGGISYYQSKARLRRLRRRQLIKGLFPHISTIRRSPHSSR